MMREHVPSAETIYYIYVHDEQEALVGVFSLRDLIISQPDVPIATIMEKDLITVEPETDQKKVAEVVSKYNLLAVPVLDKENKMLGIVTVDDVIDLVLPPVAKRFRHILG